MITEEQIAHTDDAGGIGHAAVLERLINEYIPRPNFGFGFVEIGVWSAVCASYLLERYPMMTYWGIDPYEAFQDVNQERVDTAGAIALSRLENWPNAQRLIMTSCEAVDRFEDNTIHLIFIDGNHSYESCLQDIQLWWPKTRCIIAGHEYCPDIDHAYNGVARAVRDFCTQENLKFQSGEQLVWWIIKETRNAAVL